MALQYLLKGVIIGFSLAAPIGPIGILCARGTMLCGARRGFIIGLSGALGDVIYALAAAFGVKLIFDLVVSYQAVDASLGRDHAYRRRHFYVSISTKNKSFCQ